MVVKGLDGRTTAGRRSDRNVVRLGIDGCFAVRDNCDRMKVICVVVGLVLSATSAGAQWLTHQDARPAAQGRRQGEPGRAGAAHGRRQAGLHRHLASAGGQGELEWPRDAPRRSGRHEAVGQGRAARTRPRLLQGPSRLPVPSQRRRSRSLRAREAHPADARDDRGAEPQPDVSTDLSRRPVPREGPGPDVAGLLRRPLGRRHAGGGEQRLQRPARG